MTLKPQTPIADIISDITGVYARVARKLNVSESMVGKVARGQRFSAKIDKALRDELKTLKDRLNTTFEDLDVS